MQTLLICTEILKYYCNIINTIYSHYVDVYIAPEYAAVFVLRLTRAVHLKRKSSKAYLGLSSH